MQIGEKFGKLTTTTAPYKTKLNSGVSIAAVMCECVCGVRKQVLVTNLKTGKSTSCGMCKKQLLPKAGDVVGEWTVLSVNGPFATCRCSCGSEHLRYIYSIGKQSMSCHGRKNDGRRRAKLKRIWLLMKDRCEHPDSIGWKDYGGRGIVVCPTWQNFDEFYRWSVTEGYVMLSGLQIDRIDFNGPYSPDNCRWVDRFVNARNKRNTRWLTAFGETKSLPDWLDDCRCVVTYSTLWSRIKNGWETEKAITAPTHSYRV